MAKVVALGLAISFAVGNQAVSIHHHSHNVGLIDAQLVAQLFGAQQLQIPHGTILMNDPKCPSGTYTIGPSTDTCYTASSINPTHRQHAAGTFRSASQLTCQECIEFEKVATNFSADNTMAMYRPKTLIGTVIDKRLLKSTSNAGLCLIVGSDVGLGGCEKWNGDVVSNTAFTESGCTTTNGATAPPCVSITCKTGSLYKAALEYGATTGPVYNKNTGLHCESAANENRATGTVANTVYTNGAKAWQAFGHANCQALCNNLGYEGCVAYASRYSSWTNPVQGSCPVDMAGDWCYIIDPTATNGKTCIEDKMSGVNGFDTYWKMPPPGAPATPAPTNKQNLTPKYFKRFPAEHHGWPAAKRQCEGVGGMLAIPMDADENLQAEYACGDNAHCWIGGEMTQLPPFDQYGGRVLEVDKKITWIDPAQNEKNTYINWAGGQPSNGGCCGTGCVSMRGVRSTSINGKWFDGDCNERPSHVCEFPKLYDLAYQELGIDLVEVNQGINEIITNEGANRAVKVVVQSVVEVVTYAEMRIYNKPNPEQALVHFRRL